MEGAQRLERREGGGVGARRSRRIWGYNRGRGTCGLEIS